MNEAKLIRTSVASVCAAWLFSFAAAAQTNPPRFNVIAFYNDKDETAHISFVEEAKRWFAKTVPPEQGLVSRGIPVSGSHAGNTWKPTSAILRVQDARHLATQGLPETFKSAPHGRETTGSYGRATV